MNSCLVISHARKTNARLRRASRRALTLIEMLVAVTITLMVILAIVQVFGLLGENIKTGQAVIEVTTDLRFISQQLQDDLDGITCPVRTWLDPSEARGGFEIYDGPSRDRDWNADGNFDMATSQDSSMGDVDDYLWLTTRNNETPFSGRVPSFDFTNNTEFVDYADSKDAEVTWWTAVIRTNVGPGEALPAMIDAIGQALEPTDPGRMSPTSSVGLFRHAGLVIPGIDLSPGETTSLGRRAVTLQEVLDFLDTYDVSVRWIDSDSSIPGRDLLIANSLADLTQRQNRFMRFAYIDASSGILPADPYATGVPAAEISGTEGNGGFPFPLANVTRISEVTTIANSPKNSELNAYLETLTATTDSTTVNKFRSNLAVERPRFARFPYSISIFALSGETVDSYQYYSSIMARSLVSDNIRAFDVRVYDPNAPLFTETLQPNIVIAPGDPGFPINEPDKVDRLAANQIVLSGLGAYVDLQYADSPGNANDGLMLSPIDTDLDGTTDYTVSSLFTGLPIFPNFGPLARVGWSPFYDTWSKHYERDGVNQWTSDAIKSEVGM